MMVANGASRRGEANFGDGGARFAGDNLVCRRGERQVLAGLSFSLAAGGALLLTGPNGAGKSSLLRLWPGCCRRRVADCSWDDASVASDPASHRAELAFVGDRTR